MGVYCVGIVVDIDCGVLVVTSVCGNDIDCGVLVVTSVCGNDLEL